MSIREQAHRVIEALSRDLEFIDSKSYSYPLFAQSLRQGFLHRLNLLSPLPSSEQRVFNRYEHALARFWTAFPESLQHHPLVKDLAFFLTCLFIVKDKAAQANMEYPPCLP